MCDGLLPGQRPIQRMSRGPKWGTSQKKHPVKLLSEKSVDVTIFVAGARGRCGSDRRVRHRHGSSEAEELPVRAPARVDPALAAVAKDSWLLIARRARPAVQSAATPQWADSPGMVRTSNSILTVHTVGRGPSLTDPPS